MTPRDYYHPEWDKMTKVHDWKNYISEDLISMWNTFNDLQRKLIAENAQELADREEWD